jgi:predicted lactoylglutathione lyase
MEWDWTRRVFDHVDLNVSNYPESVRFYQTVLAELGIPMLTDNGQLACFTNLNLRRRKPASRHVHLCFFARAREQVDAFHCAGVGSGFQSNGGPGYRDYAPGYYAAYLLDPDGNNIEALYRDEGNIGHDPGLTLR